MCIRDRFSSALTPTYWSDKFVEAPQIISERIASVYLTRSIPRDHKQGLKNFLNFKGYKINELYPRRTRRATAVNWLIFWAIENKCFLNDKNIIPIATNDSYSTEEDQKLDIDTNSGTLSNDTDANGDNLTAILVSDVSNGTLTFNSDGSFSYTPNANYNGSDSFTYKANDGTDDVTLLQ